MVHVTLWAEGKSLGSRYGVQLTESFASVVVNPTSRYHDPLLAEMRRIFVDSYYPEDATVMARNCNDFRTRVEVTNANAEAVALFLSSYETVVKRVYYPSLSDSREVYDKHRRRDGGYGYLMTIEFHKPEQAVAFFDALDVAKGPSLGTNFTLACAYTLLAHYHELELAAEYGVTEHLVRISVGMEEDLVARVEAALQRAIEVSGTEGDSPQQVKQVKGWRQRIYHRYHVWLRGYPRFIEMLKGRQ